MSAPPRWRDEGSEADPALRELMRHARRQGPSDAQLAALTERVRDRLPAEHAPAAASHGGAGLTLKTLAVSVGVLLAGVGGWLALSGRPDDVRSRQMQAPAANEQAVQGAAPKAEPVAVEAPGAAPEMPAAAPDRSEPAKLQRRAARGQPAPVQPAPPPDELTLLHHARQLAHSDAAGALAALREHERHYFEGGFREEREALLIELLWRTGQRTEGRARLEAFTQRYPQSAYGPRVKHWLTPEQKLAE